VRQRILRAQHRRLRGLTLNQTDTNGANPSGRRERRERDSNRPERIILVRHGQSDGNANKTAYECTPDSQIALTDVGYAQGVVAGLQIRKLVGDESVRCFYSPYARARQTLLAVLKAFDSQPVELCTEPRLREQDFGETRAAP